VASETQRYIPKVWFLADYLHPCWVSLLMIASRAKQAIQA